MFTSDTYIHYYLFTFDIIFVKFVEITQYRNISSTNANKTHEQ